MQLLVLSPEYHQPPHLITKPSFPLHLATKFSKRQKRPPFYKRLQCNCTANLLKGTFYNQILEKKKRVFLENFEVPHLATQSKVVYGHEKSHVSF